MDKVIFHSTCKGTRDGVDTRLPKDLTVACTDKQELACDSCGTTGDLIEWECDDRVTSKVYYYCNTCWFDIRDSSEEIQYAPCANCKTEDATHKLYNTLEVCEGCFLLDELCQQCGSTATETFNHLDGRSFQLCADCFGEADHEDDYGADFGSVPRLRTSSKSKLCECPLPCNDNNKSYCDLCHGIVITLKDE